jgi:hypothetical protein
MRATEDLDAKFNIYVNGKNALPLSLASLSLFAAESYGNDPLFVLYKYNFLELGKSQEDSDGSFDGFPAEEYANTVVRDLFMLDSANVEVEGALVLNVMMSIWGSLYDALRACERNDDVTNDDMYGALDTAAALWVGTGQLKNDNQEGYMLYNLAEYAGALFGQDQGESLINTLVLESFDFIQKDVDNNRCAAGVDAYVVVREKVKITISFTNVVMVQMLLHYVENAVAAGSDFVELYVLAILPHIATCDEKLYVTLVDLAVYQDVTAETKDTIINTIQASFSCLGITCDDVGTYKGGVIPKCDDSIAAGIPYLVEYLPLTDVRRKAHIDRDIREIEILMVEGAYQAATEYYLYGWNTFFSLSELAQNAYSPGPTPDFDLFKTYYGGNDYDFAHNIIMNVLEGQAPFDNISKQQRSEIVVGILRGVVMYLSTLAELDSAVTECDKNGGSASTLELWDGGAAFFIGSSEGHTPGGQAGGQFAFALAKELCDSFGTCETEPERNAEINEVVIQALLFGSENLQLGNCDVVRTVLENSIKPVLLVPLVQGTLLAASESASLEAGSDSGALGALYAFSRSVLPAIDSANKDSATQISNNSAFDPASTPVPDGIDALFGAFRAALVVIPTDCRDIGVLTTDDVENSVCETEPPSERPTNDPSSTPTKMPTELPTLSPTQLPTLSPSNPPTDTPSEFPSLEPSTTPTEAPTRRPTLSPTVTPTTEIPSEIPSNSTTNIPTQSPTIAPTQRFSEFPSNQPSSSQSPTIFPTILPSTSPSWIPSDVPSFIPSVSLTPSVQPSRNPTSVPTVSLQPTALPSIFPTSVPTVSLQPTALPSIFPTRVPSSVPTSVPSSSTQRPTTSAPTMNPTAIGSLSQSISSSPTTTATTTTAASPVGSTSGDVHGSRATTTMLLLWSTFLATVIWVGW